MLTTNFQMRKSLMFVIIHSSGFTQRHPYLGFGVVIGRYNIGSIKTLAFVTLRYEISGKYTTPLWKLKRGDIDSRKCEYLFKLCDYILANNKWKFNVIFCLHNHDMCDKLFIHLMY